MLNVIPFFASASQAAGQPSMNLATFQANGPQQAFIYDMMTATQTPIHLQTTIAHHGNTAAQLLSNSLPPQAVHVHFAGQQLPQTVQVFKRGSDELLQRDMVSNGTSTSLSPSNLDTAEAKKVKLDQPFSADSPQSSAQSAQCVSTPSKVLHIRNVPSDASESDIAQLGIPFGRMTNLVLAKKKNQALLEMDDAQLATQMVQYYAEHPPQVKGRSLIIQFSNHKELKTEQPNVAAQNALQAANSLAASAANDDSKSVLRVIVDNVLYPITVHDLHKIFSKYGGVQKIVIFNKNNVFQALIQMGSTLAAQTAKLALNGQNIYTGCCTMKIDFSKLSTLNVRYNNDKSRDFTLPQSQGEVENKLALDASTANLIASALGGGGSSGGATGVGLSDLSVFDLAGNVLLSPFANAGQVASTPPIQAASPTQNAALNSYAAVIAAALQNQNASAGLQPYRLAANAALQPVLSNLSLLNAAQQPASGSVLLVSNLNDEKVTPDALFTLFGVYGDVQRVKILYNKKDSALVQFTDAFQAQTAWLNLNGVKLYGKPMKMTLSKHSLVQMPKDGQQDSGLTKDYIKSPLHRFKKPNSKNFQNIFPPSPVLHLSNVPVEVSEEQMKAAFELHGHQVAAFKFFQSSNEKKMALAQMHSVEDAMHALIDMHNMQLSETHHLRVSFSKPMTL